MPGSAFANLAAEVRRGGLWPRSDLRTPMVLDTDIGGDPDDAIALAAAARVVPDLSLVLINDETGGDIPYGGRARFARVLLDELGRGDVTVVSGHSVGGTRYFCVDPLVPAAVPFRPAGVVASWKSF